MRNTFCCDEYSAVPHQWRADTGEQPFYTTNNEYTAATHRLFQLAANIHDATTIRHLGATNDFPSVFRPVFMRTRTNLIVRGFVEETNSVFLNNPWMTIEHAAVLLPVKTSYSNVNLYGVPLVIGAKKGYPNFNKLVVQTVADVSRRLEIRRSRLPEDCH